MIDHAREVRHACFQASLAVLVVEKARVLEARPHDPLVAGDDVARIVHAHIGDDEKAREEVALAVEQREILLVLPHRQDQALGRHLEKGGVEAAGIDLRVFDERRDFVEQVGIAAEARRLARRGFLQLPVDLRSPCGKAGDHLAVAFQARLVLIGAAQRNVVAAHETMACSAAPGGDAQNLGGNQTLAVQQDQPMRRPHELRIAATPAHQLRNRQRLQRLLERAGQHLVQHRAFELDPSKHHRPLRCVAPLELLGRKAVLAREAGDRLRGRGCRGAGHLAFASGSARCDAGDREREPARRGVDLERRIRSSELRFGERVEHALGEDLR